MVYGRSTPSGVITLSIVLVVQFIFGLMIVSSLAELEENALTARVTDGRLGSRAVRPMRVRPPT